MLPCLLLVDARQVSGRQYPALQLFFKVSRRSRETLNLGLLFFSFLFSSLLSFGLCEFLSPNLYVVFTLKIVGEPL